MQNGEVARKELCEAKEVRLMSLRLGKVKQLQIVPMQQRHLLSILTQKVQYMLQYLERFSQV